MGIHDVLPALDRFGFYFFQTLLAFLWQSSLLLGPVLLSLWVFRKRSPSLRNAIAVSGLAAVPGILVCSWLMSILPVPTKPIPVMPDYGSGTKTVFSGRASAVSGDLDLTGTLSGSTRDERIGAGQTGKTDSPGRGASHSTGSAFPDIFAFPWAIGLAVYLLIQIVLLLKLLGEWAVVRWWIWHSHTIERLPVCRLFWRAAHELEVRTGQFEIMESAGITLPMTVGATCPRVILPSGFPERCGAEDLSVIVFHELAHVRRKDPLTFTLISLARTVLFFHPLVLLIAREFSLIAEQACDEAAIVASGTAPVSYARSLARIAEKLYPIALRPAQALGFLFYRSILVQRFEAILSQRRRASRRYHPILTVAAAVCISVPLAVAVSMPLVEQDPGVQEIVPLSGEDAIAGSSLWASNTACAIPLRGIRIDGQLDDWPKHMARYPIRNHGGLYGPTDIDSVDLATSPDLSPSMMVGYNQEEGFLYVAVIVRDDRMVMVKDPELARPELTDACEIYVDGLNRCRIIEEGAEPAVAWDMPALEYVMCPEGGAYDLSAWLHEPPFTPTLLRGNVRNTGSTCACVWKEGVITYEWAVRVYNRYPEQTARLYPGAIIGFDVAVADRDSVGDTPAWVCWGPYKPRKGFDTSSLGDLVLVERYEDLGIVSGLVSRGRDPYTLKDLELYRGEEWIGNCATDEDGRFNLILPPGTYTVKAENRGARERFYQDEITVASGSLVKANLRIALNGFPRLRYESAALFRTIRKRFDPGEAARLVLALGMGR